MIDGEEKLIDLAIRGESSAFGHLYDHYQPKIYRFVVLRVGRREEAEDITHQVFLSAWQNIRRYEAKGFPFGSWLYRIARNAVIDHYRTRKNESSLDQMDADDFAAESRMPALAEERLAMSQVRLALRKLKPEYQEVIVLRFVEELSLKETAHAIEKSEGAVKLLQHRAIRELQKILPEGII